MNSLNIISARVSPQPSPAPTRTNSLAHIGFPISHDSRSEEADEDEGAGGAGSEEQHHQHHQHHQRPEAQDYGSRPVSLDSHHSASTAKDEASGRPRRSEDDYPGEPNMIFDEGTPLLSGGGSMKEASLRMSKWHAIPRRIASALINSIRWVLSTLAAPGVYLVACMYDDAGNFAPVFQLKRLVGLQAARQRHGHRRSGDKNNDNRMKAAVAYGSETEGDDSEKDGGLATDQSTTSSPPGSPPLAHHMTVPKITHSYVSSGSSTSGLSSESESDPEGVKDGASGRHHGHGGSAAAGGGHGQSSRQQQQGGTSGGRALPDSEEIAPSRRSIRIKLHSDDVAGPKRQRSKHRMSPAASKTGGGGVHSSAGKAGDLDGSGGLDAPTVADISAQLKSPTSPAGLLTRYPKTPAPPRPLVPRRQPSYVNLPQLPPEADAKRGGGGLLPGSDPHHQRKTLILDLDETLIHSMSKGGRIGTGHMVEVRLNTAFLGAGGQQNMGPQHPILYYVHKRPHCDDFLRRVSLCCCYV